MSLATVYERDITNLITIEPDSVTFALFINRMGLPDSVATQHRAPISFFGRTCFAGSRVLAGTLGTRAHARFKRTETAKKAVDH